MHTKLFAENEKICPQNKGKSISKHLKSKFSQGSMPTEPLPAWTIWAQVTRHPAVYIGVTPVTTTATAVQNSFENPDLFSREQF